MPYSTTITGMDLSDGIADVRVFAGYVFGQVNPAAEIRLDNITADIDANTFKSTNPIPFSYAGSLVPLPAPHYNIGLWIQEIPRLPAGGWLFRSGAFQTEPPSETVDVIVAPMQGIGTAELASAIGALPIVSGSTTISTATVVVSGVDLLLAATGTDTSLPAGVTFTFTATLVLSINNSVREIDSPFDLTLSNPSLTFTAGVGTGFSTALLNLFRGPIYDTIKPRLLATLNGRINSGVLSTVATRLNRGVPATMPAGVVLSVRSLRAGTRALGAGTESIIEVRAALGAFSGVASKFPPGTFGGSCFIATAATAHDSTEVSILRRWRDERLARTPSGRAFVRWYEKRSPPAASRIARSGVLRALVRFFIVYPAARFARWSMNRPRSS
jgi:hypothetical protein